MNIQIGGLKPQIMLYRHRLAIFGGAVFLLSLPFTHTVALRLIALFAMAALVFPMWKTYHNPPSFLSKPLLAWAGLALLSLVWAIDPAYSLNEIKNEIGYSMIAFLCFYSITRGERNWWFWNKVLVLGLSAVSLSGVLAYWIAPDFWRKGGLHGGVGDYSTYLITILPFVLLWNLNNSLLRLPTTFRWLLLPLVFVGGYLTLNRMFWPSLITVLIVFSALYYFRTNTPKMGQMTVVGVGLLTLLAAVLFVVAIAQKSPMPVKSSEILAETAESDPRLLIWKFAGEQLSQRPLTGAGFGRGALREKLTSHFQTPDFWHAHNLVLNYGLQMGLGGVAVLILVFGSIGREYWGFYRSGHQDVSLVGVVGLALLAGTLVKNMTDDFFVRHHALLFWALVGITLGYGKSQLSSSTNALSSTSN